MSKAARAIVIKDGKILLMRRDKGGHQYYTLVGGRVREGETLEQGLAREVNEETGLKVADARLVFVEKHPEPYDQQYTFLCVVEAEDAVRIQSFSEEAELNRIGIDKHTPMWVEAKLLPRLPFRTPGLHNALIDALKNGFPQETVTL